MALKDWKKSGSNKYHNKLKGITLHIGVDNPVHPKIPNKYWVYLEYIGKVDPAKRFKTKSQALKYAKSYMRKH
jgi:hypothetical protein